jgi:geranylgeranyl diphosphate synthase, type II
MLNVKEYLFLKQDLIETELDRMIEATVNSDAIDNAMRYSLMAGGKRIRPILCLAAVNAFGGEEKDALPAACAIEMVHTYSLIHDDLPAMDNDHLRRGQPTCHIQFDEATAILAGDGLLTLAFDTLARAGLAAGGAAAKWLNVIQMLARAAGYKGMIKGQMQDISAEGVPLKIEQLERMHSLKTGAMIDAALTIGGHLADGTLKQQQALATYGQKIGLAFQIADDLLNVNGNPQHMGKAVGTDQMLGKNTYPALLGLAKSEQRAQDLIDQALQALASFDRKADPLRVIARYIIDRNR